MPNSRWWSRPSSSRRSRQSRAGSVAHRFTEPTGPTLSRYRTPRGHGSVQVGPFARSGLGERAQPAQVGPPDAFEDGPARPLTEPTAHGGREHEILGPAELGEAGAGGRQGEPARAGDEPPVLDA